MTSKQKKGREMKDKNGIEIIRENCKHKTPCNGCGLVERDCKVGDKHCQFTPSLNALEARIAELQSQLESAKKAVIDFQCIGNTEDYFKMLKALYEILGIENGGLMTTKKGQLRRHPNSNNGNNLDAETGSLDATTTQMEIEKCQGGRKMNFELKPCPFCGGRAIVDGCDDTRWIVVCTKCDASIGEKETEREAIEEWNSRIEPTFTPDELDAIRRNVRDWRAERELSKIEQIIIDKCAAILKGAE